MNIFDKILELTLIEDLTESPLWTDIVFRALEQDGSNEQGIDPDITGTAGKPTSDA